MSKKLFFGIILVYCAILAGVAARAQSGNGRARVNQAVRDEP